MKVGDKFVCCIATQVHTLYKSYEVDKVVYEFETFDIYGNVTYNSTNIIRIQMTTDNSFLAGFQIKEFNEHFISNKEYRKLKLEKINKL